MEVCGKSIVVRTTLLYDFIAINVGGDRETTGVPCQDRRSRVVLGLLTTKRLYSFRILVCDTARGKQNNKYLNDLMVNLAIISVFRCFQKEKNITKRV